MRGFVIEDVKSWWVSRGFKFLNKGYDCVTYFETLSGFCWCDSNIVGIIIVTDHEILVPAAGFNRESSGNI